MGRPPSCTRSPVPVRTVTTTVPRSTRRSTASARPTTKARPRPSLTSPRRPSPPSVALSATASSRRLGHGQGFVPRCRQARRHPPQVARPPHVARLAQMDQHRVQVWSRSLPVPRRARGPRGTPQDQGLKRPLRRRRGGGRSLVAPLFPSLREEFFCNQNERRIALSSQK